MLKPPGNGPLPAEELGNWLDGACCDIGGAGVIGGTIGGVGCAIGGEETGAGCADHPPANGLDDAAPPVGSGGKEYGSPPVRAGGCGGANGLRSCSAALPPQDGLAEGIE